MLRSRTRSWALAVLLAAAWLAAPAQAQVVRWDFNADGVMPDVEVPTANHFTQSFTGTETVAGGLWSLDTSASTGMYNRYMDSLGVADYAEAVVRVKVLGPTTDNGLGSTFGFVNGSGLRSIFSVNQSGVIFNQTDAATFPTTPVANMGNFHTFRMVYDATRPSGEQLTLHDGATLVAQGNAYNKGGSNVAYFGDASSGGNTDMAVDFVMSKLNRSVGTRAESIQAPVRYEIPPEVVREAIVNAVAHRDYTSAGAVQVSVFADRVEVWNPGTLPAPLTTESLRHPHGSIPRNHRLCEGLFLARYIEKYGTGTLMMIRECLAHALPEPDFAQRGGEFTTAIWRDWLTEEVIASLGLNGRQRRALTHLKTAERIGNTEYQLLFGVAKRTAHRDLMDLVKKGILEKTGTTGKGTAYVLRKGATKGPKGPSAASKAKGAAKGPKGS